MKKTAVPKLRFPEFREAEGWEDAHLGDKRISSFVNDKTQLENLRLETYVSTENLLPDYEGIAIASKLPPSGSFTQFKEGDILISNIRPYLKKVWFANRDGAASNDVIVIRAGASIGKAFLSFFLKNDNFINYIMEGAKGVKMPRGDKSLMKEYPVAVPDKPEQQKIAACLTTLDDLISAQSEKIEALQAHKKGLMQQLFPAEGERVPRVRFGEFEGEWEEKTLKDACQMQAGKFVSASNIYEKKTNDLFPCYGGNGLRGYTKSFTHTGKYCLIGRQGALCGNVNLATSKFHATEHAVVATTNEGINTDWLFYLLVHLNLNQYATGQAQPGLSVDNLEKVEIKVPKKEDEQRKIADVLITIDDLINAQIQKIEALKKQKKGLMQQLFPNLNQIEE